MDTSLISPQTVELISLLTRAKTPKRGYYSADAFPGGAGDGVGGSYLCRRYGWR